MRGFASGGLSPIAVKTADVVNSVTGLTETVPVGFERIGGRDIVTGTVELSRDLPRSTGIAAFIDFGNAVDHFGDPLAYSAGIGFRWRLPGVTFGIDVAQALKDPVSEQAMAAGLAGYDKLPPPRFHLNISQRL